MRATAFMKDGTQKILEYKTVGNEQKPQGKKIDHGAKQTGWVDDETGNVYCFDGEKWMVYEPTVMYSRPDEYGFKEAMGLDFHNVKSRVATEVKNISAWLR